MSIYEAPSDGVFWSLIIAGFVLVAITIGFIWSKIGQGKK